jgi:hypothetical protein
MASQPSSPNPYTTAAAQSAAGMSTAGYNAVSGNANEVNPFGSVSYKMIEQVPIYQDGRVVSYAPRYERTTALSPDQQKLLGLETQSKYNTSSAAVEQTAKLRDQLNTRVDPSKWASWQTDLSSQPIRQDTAPTDRRAIELAMMQSYDRNTDPALRAQESKLAARGLAPGSQGYGTYQRQTEDSRAEAIRNAYIASGNESRAAQGAFNDAATSRFNMSNILSSYYNNLRGSQMQEEFALRNQPINEITALMSGSQATIPQFQPFNPATMQAPNIASYINQDYSNRAAQAAQTNQGIASLLGGGLKLGSAFV